MRRAIKDKRLSLFISILGIIGGAVLTVFAVIFFGRAIYAAMAGFALLSMVCYYGAVLRFFVYLDARDAIELLDLLEISASYGERLDTQDISDALGWSKRATKKFIARCRKRGYMR